MSAPKLGAMLGLEGATVVRMLAGVGLVAGKGYDTKEALRAIVSHYKGRAERLTLDSRKSKNDREASEAEISRMNAAKMREDLADRSQVEADLKDAIARGVRDVAKILNSQPKLRDQVLSAIRGVKLEPIE